MWEINLGRGIRTDGVIAWLRGVGFPYFLEKRRNYAVNKDCSIVTINKGEVLFSLFTLTIAMCRFK